MHWTFPYLEPDQRGSLPCRSHSQPERGQKLFLVPLEGCLPSRWFRCSHSRPLQLESEQAEHPAQRLFEVDSARLEERAQAVVLERTVQAHFVEPGSLVGLLRACSGIFLECSWCQDFLRREWIAGLDVLQAIAREILLCKRERSVSLYSLNAVARSVPGLETYSESKDSMIAFFKKGPSLVFNQSLRFTVVLVPAMFACKVGVAWFA